jgi:hypothetical protein
LNWQEIIDALHVRATIDTAALGLVLIRLRFCGLPRRFTGALASVLGISGGQFISPVLPLVEKL